MKMFIKPLTLYVLFVVMLLALLDTRIEANEPAQTPPPAEQPNQPAAPVDEAKIKELIQQLGADDFKIREDAQKELETIGESAESALQEALNEPDLEITTRIKTILRTIEITKAGKIAFVKANKPIQKGYSIMREVGASLWITDLLGKDPIELTPNMKCDHPNWSPDGTKIAFASHGEIYVINSDGTTLKKLTNNNNKPFDELPQWSPDGKRIVFVSWMNNKGQIYLIDADGKNQRQLSAGTASDQAPQWSPDGDKIAFTSGDGIFLIKLNGEKRLRLTPIDVKVFVSGGYDWAPDSKKIVFTIGDINPADLRTFKKIEIYTVDTEGKNLTRLTNNEICERWPAYSPDGKKIIFVSLTDNDTNEVSIMDANGKNQARLTDNTNAFEPCWLVNGTKIAFISHKTDRPAIYIMDTDGKNLRAVIQNAAQFACQRVAANKK